MLGFYLHSGVIYLYNRFCYKRNWSFFLNVYLFAEILIFSTAEVHSDWVVVVVFTNITKNMYCNCIYFHYQPQSFSLLLSVVTESNFSTLRSKLGAKNIKSCNKGI